ncbi:lipid-A-disaccharide synthase [Pleionea sp. CnH1-48]|uniref:lipid-A-disaccharide synthase n=1 Tax=Pleionea sp. CnH1-48 TaxID=2954494 RepID=UPI002097EB03|nr:lipid-A-disaccharide synthase [Pleionea sp. CnH1-48]MCO7226491.1 lipid-A-disaccharide synthase [Pleionea sp. CnH1-48]
MSNSSKIFLVAGEASGDLLGAGLIRELKKRYGDAYEFEGIAGESMMAEGCQSVYPMERLAVMGIVAVLKRYRELSKVRKQLIEQLIQDPPAVFIGIDAPEFNLDFELALREAGIKTVHYVSPSVWAWRPKRIFKIKRAVDLMLCLFTFEEKYYHEHNVDVACVGHSMADKIDVEVPVGRYRNELGLAEQDKVLAVLPGSRGSEIKYITQPFIEAAYRCWQDNPELKIVVPVINEQRKAQFEQVLSQLENKPPMTITVGNARQVMGASDVVLLASGTATLEATLLKKPMVVGYKMSGFSYAIFSRMLKIKNVSLPNLLAGESLVPEYIQKECQPELLAEALMDRLNHPEKYASLIQSFRDIHLSLKKDADVIAADAISKLLPQ